MRDYKLCRDSQLVEDIWNACKGGKMVKLRLIDGSMLFVTPLHTDYLPSSDDEDDDADAITFAFRFGACVTLRGSDIESYELLEKNLG